MMRFKKLIKKIVPDSIYVFKHKYNFIKNRSQFFKLNSKETFKKIYKEKIWTPEKYQSKYKFYSGLGSHKKEFVEIYIKKTIKFLKKFKKKPKIVELGCGDFKVSENLVKYSGSFTACDIYDELIFYNKKKYKNLKVIFKVLDFTKNNIPNGDICILRCVLQHLSNEMIFKFLKKIKGKFKYLIVTEHCPENDDFKPNLNIYTGPDIRLNYNSAVELSESPFFLNYKEKKILCKISSKLINGFLKTQIYRLK